MATKKWTYERTHPWLQFTFDARRLSFSAWTFLGESKSMCASISLTPLRPDVAEQLYRVFLAKGVQATTAIEGNTLSEAQVLAELDGVLEVPPSQEYLKQEVANVITAFQQIAGLPLAGKTYKLDVAGICEVNRAVLVGLELDDGVIAGRIREHEVRVGKYAGAPSEECQMLLQRMCDWLNDPGLNRTETDTDSILWAIIRAALAHLYIAWIHPFGDGNGRTARLVEYQILLRSGVPAPSAHVLSNHYNMTRTEYYRQLAHASESRSPDDFVEYSIQGFRDGLIGQSKWIREQLLDIVWRNYVHERFREKSSKAHTRRRTLLLDLSRQEKPVPHSQLRVISPLLAEAYAKKTKKTLSRDLTALIEMGLIEKTRAGYRARREVIYAFMPRRGP